MNKQLPSIAAFLFWTSLLFLILQSPTIEAQNNKRNKSRVTSTQSPNYPEKLYDALQWRNIGPFRGGRSCAVTGVPNQPDLYYFGSTGGGVWRTTNSGKTWENISDGYFGGSIGAVAVSEWDNNVIYVGGGEKTVRGNVSYGYGVWKSVDAGKTWEQMGLKNSRHISRIRIHPKNPDLVYAAVMGDLFKPTSERGVYRSKDGGKTWKKILYSNDLAGAVDLTFDPTNPRILYASTWRIQRTPYSLSSGGEGSALWKSTDGGETWKNLSEKKGMPKAPLGIIGVAVSPANPDRVWAMMEAKEGGLFRSEDGGETWKKVNNSRALRQRAWYYTRVYADTKDADKVYVVNVRYQTSTDGGKTFKARSAPHGDHHDLWIAPENPDRMIMGDDGGAQITEDGGKSWSTYHNQPTAQFYRVTTDDHFPYRIYGAQQDNSTVRILHRSGGWTIDEDDWESTAGGESAHIAIDPNNNDIVYGGSYDGFLTRKNHENNQTRAINVWPDNPMGHGAEGMKYRFQWNFPIFFSPHNPKKLYAASNHLHVSEDEGQSWQIISPDLTRNDSTKLVSSGGPITQDNTSVEYYCTIFAAAESPYEKDLLWAASDDGLVHISRDAGKNWSNVTPKGMPEWMMFNGLEIDPFHKGGVYLAGTRYKLGDYRPYLYHSKDYGKTWQKITNGIDSQHFTRAIRADPKRQGLLYAGTETGMYISFNDGLQWQPFQLNLPIVPITDLAIKNDNLIAATQGRSFWLIDDLTPLHQLNSEIARSKTHLFQPMPTYRMDGGSTKKIPKTAGQNHPNGVMVHFYFNEVPDTSKTTISLEFLEMNDEKMLIKKYSTKPDKKKKEGKLKELKEGMNRFVWNMKYPDAESFEGMVLWWGNLSGPQALPGNYLARLVVGEDTLTTNFEVLADPRIEATLEELKAQFDFIRTAQDKVTETHTAIKNIRKTRKQLNFVKGNLKDEKDENEDFKAVVEEASRIDSVMSIIEKELYQTKNRSRQDPLNFPIKLNNKLAHLLSLTSIGDYQPTDQTLAFFKEVTAKIDEQLTAWYAIMKKDIPAFNQMVREKEVDAVVVE